ncbi:MAG: hypothetical protein ABL958_05640, partial [Bdellovibrionia bacterium]
MSATRLALFVFAAFAVSASTLTEDINTTAYDPSGTTLVWNHALGYVHPTLSVTNVLDPGFGPLPDEDFSIGVGTYGAFNETTYSRFSTGGDVSGNIIRLDTTVYEFLDVTLFNLAAGWTLQPSGPLVIRSLTTVEIAGAIECSGAPGENISNDPTHVAVGGQGRCGGGNGGNGGTALLPPTAGTGSGAGVGGGQAGISFSAVNGGDSGAGGGAYGLGLASNGQSPSIAADAVAGTSVDDLAFTQPGGGGGGGGGFAYAQLTGDDSNGGAGGGGLGGLAGGPVGGIASAVGLGGGGGGSLTLADGLVSLRLTRGMAPDIDMAEILLTVVPGGPDLPAPGDTGSVGVTAGDLSSAFACVVDLRERHADGLVRITATNGGRLMARARVNLSFAEQAQG